MSTPPLAPFVAEYSQLRLAPVADWADLFARMRTITPASVVLVDPYADDPAAPSPDLFRLLDSFPSAAVLVGIDLTPGRVGDARRMMEAGISGIVNLRLDTTSALAARHFHDAVGRPLKRRVEAVLPPHLPSDARTILRAACGVAVLGGGAQTLADVFGVTQKTLGRWCEAQRLPTTRSIQFWMRLLLATLLLEDEGRTALSAALAAGYSSDRALRRAFEQVFGSVPGSLRRGSAFDRVAEGFSEYLRAMRAGGAVR